MEVGNAANKSSKYMCYKIKPFESYIIELNEISRKLNKIINAVTGNTLLAYNNYKWKYWNVLKVVWKGDTF